MRKLSEVFLMFAVMMLACPGFGQKNLAVLEFADELCTYKGYYDADKYSEAILKDTYKLTQSQLFFDGDDEESLQESYEAIKQRLSALKIVPNSSFSVARDSMLRYVEESYAIQKIRVKATDNPEVLKRKFMDDKLVKSYVEALVKGGDLLLAAYADVVKRQMENNGIPESLWAKYEANMQLDHREEIAFDYVLTYGWWNRVNNLIYHFNFDGSLNNEFNGLFVRVVTIDCDEA
ncbi:hypothetical protein ACFSQ3_14040 [Sphingobacterium corticis]|uniref:DUF4919 domain-containing protein n=1 Tax=Sphingobacterium corticis TaxID=1812823 RepID=A0ABW5NN44_9SPHI